MCDNIISVTAPCQLDPFVLTDDDIANCFPEPPAWLFDDSPKIKGKTAKSKIAKIDSNKITLDSTFSSIFVSEEEKAVIAHFVQSDLVLNLGKGKEYDYIPRNTLLYDVAARFRKHTDIPLSLPFFLTMQLFSAFLLKEKVTISVCGHIIDPTLWIVVLCESGAGKSFALSELTKRLQKVLDMRNKKESVKDLTWNVSGIVSTLEFMIQWSGLEETDTTESIESHNRRLIVVDEASNFFERLRNEKSNIHDMYSRFLDSYSHSAIEYSSRAAGMIRVDNPVVSFVALATPDRYINKITPDDIEGGFYYRFLHFIDTVKRSMRGHAIYPANMLDGIEVAWSNIISSVAHNEYTVPSDALLWYNRWFDTSVAKHSTMPRAYLRRSSFSMHQLALLLHIFLGHGNKKEICIDAYKYADKIMIHFNRAAKYIIEKKDRHAVSSRFAYDRTVYHW